MSDLLFMLEDELDHIAERYAKRIIKAGISREEFNEFFNYMDDWDMTERLKLEMDIVLEGKDREKAKKLGWIEPEEGAMNNTQP